MPHPIAAVIFDLDGVIRHWRPSLIDDAESNAGLPPGVLAEAVLRDAPLLHRVTTGLISDSEWRQEIADNLTRNHGEGGARAVRAWSSSPGEVVVEVLDMVRATRRRATVAILSNATTRLAEDLDRLGIRHEVDAVFNSSDLGYAKPDPVVFDKVCSSLGVRPEACAFVDDSPRNVAAAQQVGLTSHLHHEQEALRQFLNGLNLG